MSTSTATRTYTRTHTATYLTDLIMGALSDVLAHLEINADRLYRDWAQDQRAISAWIEEASLDAVILECHRPGGSVTPIFEFPVTYDVVGEGHGRFVNDQARLARYRAKIGSVPAGTTYQLFCTFNGPRTPQGGWVSGTRSSTEGLRSTSFGTLGEGPHARAGLRHLT